MSLAANNPVTLSDPTGLTRSDAGDCPTPQQTSQVTQQQAQYGAGCPASVPGCPGSNPLHAITGILASQNLWFAHIYDTNLAAQITYTYGDQVVTNPMDYVQWEALKQTCLSMRCSPAVIDYAAKMVLASSPDRRHAFLENPDVALFGHVYIQRSFCPVLTCLSMTFQGGHLWLASPLSPLASCSAQSRRLSRKCRAPVKSATA